ncbi:hypothetical protein ACOME3_007678 [Neoechinorhynchus agilis]
MADSMDTQQRLSVIPETQSTKSASSSSLDLKNTDEQSQSQPQQQQCRLLLINRLLGVLVVFGILVFALMFVISYAAIVGCSSHHQSIGDRIRDLPRALFGRFLYPENQQLNTTKYTESKIIRIGLCEDRYGMEVLNGHLESLVVKDPMGPFTELITSLPPLANTTSASGHSRFNRSFLRFPLDHHSNEYRRTVTQNNQIAIIRSRSVVEECGVEITDTLLVDTNQCSTDHITIDHVLEFRGNKEIEFCKDDQYDLLNQGMWFPFDVGSFQPNDHNNSTNLKLIGRLGSLNSDSAQVEFYSNQKQAKSINYTNGDTSAIRIDTFGHALRDCEQMLMAYEEVASSDNTVRENEIFIIHNQYHISH